MFLNIFNIQFNQDLFCDHLCNKNKKTSKYVNFKLKNQNFKAKVFTKIDICLKECKENVLKMRKKFVYGAKNNELEDYYKIKEEQKNYCTNKIDPKTLSEKEYLLEFAKGPCNPLAILPGLYTSKLEIVITDCQKFKKNYPKIYKNCDLGNCSNKKPWKIYQLWMASGDSPLSMFSPNEKYTECFSEFMEVLYVYNEKEKKYDLSLKEGLKVRVKGINEKNGKESQCGVDSVQNITPDDNKEFKYFTKYLIGIGYKVGINLQYLPYDFRLSYKENDLNILFKENIERLYKLNFKKVIMITHSLGSLNGLYQIKKNEKYEIYKKLGNFIAVGGPFFGANGVLSELMNLFSPFYKVIKGKSFGVNRKSNEKLGITSQAGYDLLPPNPKYFINKKWFQWVFRRINHENYKFNETYINGANLLPNVNDKCYEGLLKNKCIYDLQNYFKSIITFYNNESIKTHNIEDKIGKYVKNEQVVREIKYTQKNSNLYEYNPKVQQTFIFINSIKTPEGFEYKRDITKELLGENYIIPDVTNFRNGDGTVSTFSVLLKAYKQAYEFEKEKNKDYKPVKILELCSKHSRINKNETFYDKFDEKLNQYVFTRNSYNGIECTCDNDKDKSKYKHGKMFSDKKLYDSIFKLIQLNEKIDLEKYKTYLETLSIKELKSYSEDCVQLRYIGYGYKKYN